MWYQKSEKMLRKKKKKDTRTKLTTCGQCGNHLSIKERNRKLDIAPKNKINMPKSIPTDINKFLDEQRSEGQGTTFPYKTPIKKYGWNDRSRKSPPETTATTAAGNASQCTRRRKFREAGLLQRLPESPEGILITKKAL